MIRRFRVLSAAFMVAALAVSSGCSSSDDEASTGGSSAGGKVDKVVYATAFGAVGRDSFVWLAKEKGYFKEAGIDIDIQKGAGNVQNLTMIKSDQAQFAALDFTGAVIQAGTGKFTDWKAVAAIHQQTLVAILTTQDTKITSPADLQGKTVAAGAATVSQLLFPAYAKLAGIDPTKVTIKGVQTTALNSLMAKNQVDALSTFLLSKKALETASKKQVTVLPYSTYLSDLYGNAIIAKPSLISSNPDLVKRFVAAAMKGLQYTLEHPDEAAAVMNKAEPTAAIPAAIGEIDAMKPYTTAPGGGALGSMDEQRVAKSIAVLSGAGLMPDGLKPTDVVDFSFTPKA
ncbi:ABC transporter substrate-binding protein [Winogradskya consettensis]|uniref:Sulfonate ABC transporter substrate-binding protein n=1 Tax=Winogradskya consettensis TaxID=113560 RepID=A0A919T2R5_9ACTN|nr:ABC transporter substrate-binding protein [Actinoplanes consettensis]GIM84249.1 sulfonate ABC transporter substrate-binding protein [Actinoplanes consettensis]